MDDGATLLELYRAGRAAWPAAVVDYDAFRVHCERVLGTPPIIESPEHGADLYLCCACAVGEAWAMSVVERRCSRVVVKAIARVWSDADFVQETTQEFWDRLFAVPNAKIAAYSARGSLDAWVRVVATRLALDRARTRRRAADRQVELGEYLAGECRDPDCGVVGHRYSDTFRAALRKAIADLSPRDRNVLRMHLFGRLGIDEIGRMFGVHRATVARWLERTRHRLRDSTRRHFDHEFPGLSASEFFSVARALESVVDVSIGVSRSETRAVSSASMSSGIE